ncbi:hypothetical protein GE21DRAFT_196 [Neurospora crassa]|uniref:Uncharacterized protein n=1 Tax=Neurospora crassa (strain ATCC 24698 / 74-OR23-1A / CBS 708.71 / DSM 1257 / FGSC 987) TaxID=367110 RepID=Q7SFS6_NEUCR|nr:hypothetical protein NCU09073 [Neurospora crassa OR74A]EAA35654.1 hypothetical protein NCU09073 [Neurospora crassa OR74A]KHE82438.1 hypothetical protein GE21DRAFT_196 [Neurospora crassa]|eukprot:XP_964890.1 hypothetical protein NCU09073 [Neurospora crassa OR74A]
MPPPRRGADLSLWDCFQIADQERVRGFADQYYSPNYVEEYEWNQFNPDYFSGPAFQSLPLEEQFRHFPKGIVENVDNYLDGRALDKMLAYMGESRDDRYVDWLVDHQREAWHVAKRFNLRLESRRSELERELGEGEVERIRGAMRAARERQKVVERERRERKLREGRRELAKQRAEERQKKLREEEEIRKQAKAKEMRVRRELVGDLNSGAWTLREQIARFAKGDESVTIGECEALIAQIGRFIRLFTRRLKAHVASQMGEVSWRVVWAAVGGVISVLELIYFDDVTEIQRTSYVEWRNPNVLFHVATSGAREDWGSLLRSLLFQTGINHIMQWVRARDDIRERLRAVLVNMDRHGMSGAREMANEI